MTQALLTVTLALGLAVMIMGVLLRRERRRARATGPASARRILFPFAGRALSTRALEAALRLAVAERATLVPVFLVHVPMHVPLDAPLPAQCTEGASLLETIEQRATAVGVSVDARMARGRDDRHALREAIGHERFDRIVAAVASAQSEGFHSEDVTWLLDNAPVDVVIIRPAGNERRDAPSRSVAPDG